MKTRKKGRHQVQFCLLFHALATAFFLLCGCDQTPMEEYKPPVLEGTAYVLAGVDHLAVVDLKNQALSRIQIGKKCVDLVATPANDLYILAVDGEFAKIPEDGTAFTWHKVTDNGRSLTVWKDNTFLVLGEGELVQVTAEGVVNESMQVPAETDSLFASADFSTLWLLSREKATAQAVLFDKKTLGSTISAVGNSIHQGMVFPANGDLWVAEGNEFMNGEPYGVGFMMKGPAMSGGINVMDPATGKQTDFIMVGGNVADLAISKDGTKVYAAVSRLPDFTEGTLSIVDSENRRVRAELRLCLSCHTSRGVEIDKDMHAVLRAVAVIWRETPAEPQTGEK